MKKLTALLLRSSIWLASIGLMLASSGLDGAYLARLMNPWWLGLVLNTVSDVTSEIVMYWFGRLQQDPSSTKRKRSRWLLVADAVLVGYSWLFSWRQLLLVLPPIEGENSKWLAPIMAGFVPISLVACGFAQSLLSGRIEKEQTASNSPNQKGELSQFAQPSRNQAPNSPTIRGESRQVRAAKKANIDDWRRIRQQLDANIGELTANRVNEVLQSHGFAPVSPSTARYWLKHT